MPPPAFGTRAGAAAVAASAAAAGLAYYLSKQPVGPALIDEHDLVGRRVGDAGTGGEFEYDVIIVGGGTAGCVLASRLSEDPAIRVLLLEAGGSSLNVLESQMPAGFGGLLHSKKYDWNLYTEPQTEAYGKHKFWPRAKMLGGCSAINAMMFNSGAPQDYDEWARICEDSSWSYKEINKYFLKFEKFVPSGLYPHVDPSLRGANGPMEIGYHTRLTDVCAKWIQSCVKLGIAHNPDVNTQAGCIGVTKIMTYVNSKGTRTTTERAYLTPEVLRRPNLKVVTHAFVTRILFEQRADQTRAVEVEFTRDKKSPRYRARANKEIILSAGAVHTPHILMLSGVGPQKHLESHAVPVVRDMPGVGQNLQDHIGINLRFRVKPGSTLSYLKPAGTIEVFKGVRDLLQWKMFGSGPLTTNFGEGAAFVRTDDSALFTPAIGSKKVQDESSGPGAPDLELIVMPMGVDDHGFGPVNPGSIVTSSTILLRPQSRGTITLGSSDPFKDPIIDPKYLTKRNDIDVQMEGLRIMSRIASTEPLASMLVHDDHADLDHNTHGFSDAELEERVRRRCETLYHPACTARMAPLGEGGVVDSQLRVYGIPNLRIADASVFPRIVAGHTAGPCIAIAEKAADMIKADFRAGN